MDQPKSETPVSLGSIAERADKLESTAPKAEEKAPESKPADAAPESKPEDKKPEAPKPEEKKPEPTAPNDPTELRKWNTKVSMELADVKKQLQALAEALSKSTKKPVDWKELAKDPAKLQAAVEELNAQTVKEWQEKHDSYRQESIAKIAKIENQRRFHDPNYPRWSELNPLIVKMAASADTRIDFDKDPADVLDQLYQTVLEDVSKDPNYKAPPPPPTPRADLKYSEQELQAKIAEAVRKATEEAAKGLKAEEQAAGAGSMGKGAQKGNSGVDKQALWNMPMDALKNAIQKASEK